MGRNVVSRRFQVLASKHAACAKDCCWAFWPQESRHLYKPRPADLVVTSQRQPHHILSQFIVEEQSCHSLPTRLRPTTPDLITFSVSALMAPTLRTRGNAQASKTVASTGSKRKRGGASATHADPAPKKPKEKKTADAVSDKRTACQKAADDEANTKEFRIKFYQEFCPPHPGDVPEEHQIKFKHIQQLGKMSYESYAIQPRPDTIDKPWELENKRRAKQMVYWAVRSRDDYQNEDSWRMELEPYVFKRFKIEVGWYDTFDLLHVSHADRK